MNPKDILFISDMDDTLLDDGKRISGKNAEAVCRFREKGGTFTAATGRSISGFSPYQKKLNLNIPVILYNGSCIYDYGEEKILWKRLLPESIKEMLEKTIAEFPAVGVQVMEETGICSYHATPVYEAYMKRENLPYRTIKDFGEISKDWIKAEMTTDTVDQKVFDAYLREHIPEDCRWLATGKYSREVVARGVSKGDAVKQYVKLMGLEHKKICCIGDHNNDYEMIKNADIGIAVGNALECIKKTADYVVADNNCHAVYKAMKMLALI